MTLAQLLEGVEVRTVKGPLDVEVKDLAYDSRRVRPGSAFFALAGTRADGGAFARAAVEAGAVAVIGSAPEAGRVTAVAVADPRVALARAAIRFHGDPARDLEIVGVTGTNGKTTTTWMLESIFRAAGRAPGVIGTTGVRIGGETRPAAFTTPEAPELQAVLAEMRDRGVRSVAMEVSSHALAQRRAYGVGFDVVVFTNLTQDHLDYHGTMERYLDAKLMLFDGRNGATGKPTIAVVNAEDPSASRLSESARRAGYAVHTFAADPAATRDRADLQVGSILPRTSGLDLSATYAPRPSAPGVRTELGVRLPLLGRYNASNAAAAMTAALALGVDRDAVVQGLESMSVVPGRLEPVEAGQPFLVAVDYAHTPDALERALAAVRDHARGRVLLVFGCGGDRDRAKRPLMGRAAAAGADRAWVTNDNPRSEDPAAIARAIVAGAPGADLEVELDRRAAIAAALAAARPGDAVLIAGKGHETTQAIGDRVTPFDDREVARELLRRGRPDVSPGPLRAAGAPRPVAAAATAPATATGDPAAGTLTLPLVARLASGDLIVREVPGDATAREALLRRAIEGASIDSRSLKPGELFVPLRGAHADGHRFLPEAFARGAAAALCARAAYPEWRGREPGPLVLVDDVTEGLQRLARGHRDGWAGLLVGVTGSAGKTTTKDLVAGALQTGGETLATAGNLNNHWGVPLTLLRLGPAHRAAVVEMAMSGAGEIATLAGIARPEAAVITNAGRAHLGGPGLGSVAAIAREKAALARAVPPGRPVFAGADSPELLAALEGVRARVVRYGFAPDAEVRPRAFEDLGPEGSRLEVEGFPALHLRLVGRHQAQNALAALAVAREYRLDPAAVVAALAAARPGRGRMEVRRARGAELLVDCYNANPDSTRAALATLAGWPARRRIAVLGDMLELGPEAARLHAETGEAVRDAELWLVGAHAADTATGAARAGVTARVFAGKPELAAALTDALAPGVVVLLKASRGAALEDVLVGIGED